MDPITLIIIIILGIIGLGGTAKDLDNDPDE